MKKRFAAIIMKTSYTYKKQIFLNRDEHVEVISELATKPGWNWHKIAKCIYEDEYLSIIRWEDNGEIVTHVSTIKNDQVWRAVISRVPKASSDQYPNVAS